MACSVTSLYGSSAVVLFDLIITDLITTVVAAVIVMMHIGIIIIIQQPLYRLTYVLLAGTPLKNWRISLEQSLTAHTALADVN